MFLFIVVNNGVNRIFTINQRYINRLCTLIISNHSQDELVERLGEPTVGRLTENGITLAFNWKSYRQK
jgi:DNA replication protein DnaC